MCTKSQEKNIKHKTKTSRYLWIRPSFHRKSSKILIKIWICHAWHGLWTILMMEFAVTFDSIVILRNSVKIRRTSVRYKNLFFPCIKHVTRPHISKFPLNANAFQVFLKQAIKLSHLSPSLLPRKCQPHISEDLNFSSHALFNLVPVNVTANNDCEFSTLVQHVT